MTDIRNVWKKAARRLRRRLNEDTYDRWIAGIVALDLQGNTAHLGVSNNIFSDWLSSNYRDIIQEALEEVTGRPIRVVFESGHEFIEEHAAETDPAATPAKAPKPTQKATKAHPGASKPGPAAQSTVNYNRRFTFNAFVVGENNKFAHAACQAVAKTPGKAYNPLFIHGGTGLGKTHLLQAIAQDLMHRRKRARVEYMSSEEFANGYINALTDKALPKFRRHYRNVDLLLIDDVHFFTGKEQLQEEFFHTFNALYNGHKQIVLTSDRPPHEIGGLEKRLVSRFEWGLATEIVRPDLETRIAILKKKQNEHNVHIPVGILTMIASRIKSNIRRLEGALIRLVSYASITGQEITQETAEVLLRPLIDEESTGMLTIEQIQRAVAKHFDIRIADMSSKKRPQSIAYPRQIAMYLCRDMTELSSPAIADSFNRNHATVLHACNAIKKKMEKDSDCRQVVALLERKLRS